MLSPDVVLEVSRLLAAGELSQRAIAAKLGVSRGSVGNIASGRCSIAGRLESARLARRDAVAGLPMRCPGCGGLVYAPCLLCEIRKRRRRERLRLTDDSSPPDPRRAA
jgi:predicted XRE-type DNA-binding protein